MEQFSTNAKVRYSIIYNALFNHYTVYYFFNFNKKEYKQPITMIPKFKRDSKAIANVIEEIIEHTRFEFVFKHRIKRLNKILKKRGLLNYGKNKR